MGSEMCIRDRLTVSQNLAETMKRMEALIFRVSWLLISFRQDFDHWWGHRQFHQRGNNVQGHREGVAGVPAETDRGQGGGLCQACGAQLPGRSTHYERTGSVFVCSFSLSLCIMEDD